MTQPHRHDGESDDTPSGIGDTTHGYGTGATHRSEHDPQRTSAAGLGLHGGPSGASQGPPSGGPPRVLARKLDDLVAALPYLLGFHPDDSIVVVGLHGEHSRCGGRIRIGIPANEDEWTSVAVQVAACLESSSRTQGDQPDGAMVFLCQEPGPGESSRDVMVRLRPLAQRLRLACGRREIPVFEALCVSGGRYFSYCCPDKKCCPPKGRPMADPATSTMAAAATYAGIRKPESLRDMEARLKAVDLSEAGGQERALDAAGAALVPRMLADEGLSEVRTETLGLVSRMLERFRDAPVRSAKWEIADAEDDGLLNDAESAAVILGLQDRRTRDRAAEWMEGQDVGPALRLWRALARRCVGPYGVHAAAPLTLAGWVAWSAGDEPAARVALSRALRADPDYVFAQLLRRACNEGMDPEPLRRCMRREKKARATTQKTHGPNLSKSPAPDDAPRNTP